ncbi:tetratricopeptide repeat protein [Sulfurisoma sediminicola]|uniref:Tetratricopeptide (TPR) repeat protein n=1 Tax=Sulfurisoma sediminicola TaxID=1381557 RepID=A0A497XCP7_9PROT|nr:tetratricopeptide repeat protein [Sulfurisoma sediminicola]RLJ64732.1 tetratricopeptide (TPR) repeat protein [Sulfurisoma sediminicola]
MSRSGNLDRSTLAGLPPRYAAVVTLLQEGKARDAAEHCKAILQRDPCDAEAYHLLGLAAASASSMEDACENFRQAAVLAPRNPTYFFNLGNAYTRLGRHAEGAAAFRNALESAPEEASCWFNLGNAEHARGDNAAADAAFQRAVEIKPDYVRAWLNLGNVRRELGRYAEAQAALEQAIRLEPESSGAVNNLGNLLREIGRPEEARKVLEDLLRRSARHFRAWNNYGSALRESGHLEESIKAYRQAIALQPDHAQAHLNLSMALLAAGQFDEGWKEYEWRWKAARETKGYQRDFKEPLWQGQPLHGETILLHAEQGLGDALQFVRYAPLVAARGGRVIVECQGELKGIFGRMPGIAVVVARGEPLPPFDLQCPMMSLPLAFRTDAQSIPAEIPYLAPDPAKVAAWREYFGRETRPKVGLVWAGNPRRHDPVSNMIDRRRSFNLEQMRPLLEQPGFAFYSLQKGEAQTELARWLGRIEDIGSRFADFDDTAAAVSQLDLVITVDTSVAHIVGALGRPVWMLSRFDACWRWGPMGETSAWYPTMTVFRQERYGDWSAPLAKAAQRLAGEWMPAKPSSPC